MTRHVCKYLIVFLTLLTLITTTGTTSAQVRRLSGPAFKGIATKVQKLSTSKAAYNKAEDVVITGDQFTRDGRVRLSLTMLGSGFAGFTPIMEWDVYADNNGKFQTNWVANYEGSRFSITATDVSAVSTVGTEFIVMGGGASLEQCRNGANGSPQLCIGSAWANGDLNASQASYLEGESIPYRVVFSGLDTSISHTVTIEWDTTVSKSTHALDYITSYNRSETDADPCTGIGTCNPLVYTTYAIPVDPLVTMGNDGILGTADDITQIPGNFTIWGGTITGVSAYAPSGSFDGASAQAITITFTASSPDVVLAWGGHISTRPDWGVANSAISISGAPFHTRVNQFDGSSTGMDRGVQSSAVIFPAKVIVIVSAQPHAYTPFSFSTTGLDITAFTLDDNGIESDTYQSVTTFDNITYFGTGYPIKISEDPPGFTFSLTNITCVSDPSGGLGSGTCVTSLVDRQAVITLNEGETVTATFFNTSPTAALVAVNGAVTQADGTGIPNVAVTATKLSTGEVLLVKTNAFGNFQFLNIEAGEDYIFAPRSSKLRFEPGAAMLNVTGNEQKVVFTTVANP